MGWGGGRAEWSRPPTRRARAPAPDEFTPYPSAPCMRDAAPSPVHDRSDAAGRAGQPGRGLRGTAVKVESPPSHRGTWRIQLASAIRYATAEGVLGGRTLESMCFTSRRDRLRSSSPAGVQLESTLRSAGPFRLTARRCSRAVNLRPVSPRSVDAFSRADHVPVGGGTHKPAPITKGSPATPLGAPGRILEGPRRAGRVGAVREYTFHSVSIL